jgi:hypothetical protein
VLREKALPQPTEVLVLTYTCDLSFFEDVCVRQARARGARVTVLYDADRLTGGPADSTVPIRDYVPVPVLCRSSGAFHPKLMVIASATHAVVSIGSGNATSAGWHHNAEIWTHLLADGPTVPQLIGDLASWLRRLPQALWIDNIGAERLAAIADLLTSRPVQAEPLEPQLLTNDQTPIIDQLPTASGGADRLEIASPFFDPPAAALTALLDRLKPAQLKLLLTRDIQCNPASVEQALKRVPAAEITTPRSSRYHHGKAMEWWSGATGILVTGSANCTRPALMKAMTHPGGNCELALLQQTRESLLGSADALDCQLDDVELRVREAGTEDPPSGGLRLLTVRVLDDRVEAWIVTRDGSPPAGLVIELGDQTHILPLVDSRPPLHQYAADVHVAQAAGTATVLSDDGSILTHALVSEPDQALATISHPSPLEEHPLEALLRDPERLNALFDALDELAAIRLPRHTTGKPRESHRARLERAIRSTVGPALLRLTLGQESERPTVTEDEPDHRNDHDRAEERTIDEHAPAQTPEPSGTLTDAVDAMDKPRRVRLQRRIQGMIDRAPDWPLPGQLAGFRVVLIFAAAGLWTDADALAWILHDSLYNLWCAEEDEAFACEHAALATIGFAALRQAQQSCGHDTELAAAFDSLRSDFAAHQEWLLQAPDDLIVRYTHGLSGLTFGIRFTGTNIRNEVRWLIARHPIDDLLSTFTETAVRAPDGKVTIHTTKQPRRTVLTALDKLRDYPDTHVLVCDPDGQETHGWWNGRRLRLLTPTADGWMDELWPNLFTGIASYAKGHPLPAAATKTIVRATEPLQAGRSSSA